MSSFVPPVGVTKEQPTPSDTTDPIAITPPQPVKSDIPIILNVTTPSQSSAPSNDLSGTWQWILIAGGAFIIFVVAVPFFSRRKR